LRVGGPEGKAADKHGMISLAIFKEKLRVGGQKKDRL
jgi:hypothetical protein